MEKIMKSSELKTANGVFFVGNGGPLTPEQFGIMAVKSAIDDTIKDAGEIVGNDETEFRTALAAKSESVHLHLIALQAAALYVYVARYLAAPREVLGEIYQGINTGFEKVLVNGDGSAVDKNRADFLELALRCYSHSLYDELSAKQEDIGFNLDRGATASIFSESIAKLCGVQASPIDKMFMEQIAANNGIIYLLELGKSQYITYHIK